MITSVEYNRAVRYARKMLMRNEYKVLSAVYEARDAVNDGFIRLIENSKDAELYALIIETRNAIGAAVYSYIKSNPKLMAALRNKSAEDKRVGRENISDWYVKDILRQRGKELTNSNISELRAIIQQKRAGRKKYELINIVIPPLPEGAIYLPTLSGYEDCIGYCITNKGELYSCKGNREKMATEWSKKKIKENGSTWLWINGKTKTIYPKIILMKNQL